MLNKGSIDISSMSAQTEFKDFISTLVLCMFEKLLWLIVALFEHGFPAESLKACATFRQLALMADSSLKETQHPSYMHEASLDTWMYHKRSMTAVTAAHVNAWLRLILYHVLLVGLFIIILMNVTRGFASVIYELGPNLIWLIWTDLFWVLMVLLFKETKCILESDFKACIDLLCSFTTEID